MRGRVRWGNVGRVLGPVAAVAVVVAWPRLASPLPVVPGDAVVPVATPPPSGAAPAVKPRGTRRRLRGRPGGGGGSRGGGAVAAGGVRQGAGGAGRAGAGGGPREPDAAPADPHVAPPPAAPQPAPPTPAPAVTQPPADPAEREFGFER